MRGSLVAHHPFVCGAVSDPHIIRRGIYCFGFSGTGGRHPRGSRTAILASPADSGIYYLDSHRRCSQERNGAEILV